MSDFQEVFERLRQLEQGQAVIQHQLKQAEIQRQEANVLLTALMVRHHKVTGGASVLGVLAACLAAMSAGFAWLFDHWGGK
jgi:hypothetical protein